MSEQEEIAAYHKALDDVLTLFVRQHGWDYACVEAGLEVLAKNIDKYPTSMPLVIRIRNKPGEGIRIPPGHRVSSALNLPPPKDGE